MRLGNACVPPLVTGLAQGWFEEAFVTGFDAEWELSAEGDLTFDIVPA